MLVLLLVLLTLLLRLLVLTSPLQDCTVCAAGRYVGSAAQTACIDCAAGKHHPQVGQTACISCSAGATFQATAAQVSCSLCAQVRNTHLPWSAVDPTLPSPLSCYRPLTASCSLCAQCSISQRRKTTCAADADTVCEACVAGSTYKSDATTCTACSVCSAAARKVTATACIAASDASCPCHVSHPQPPTD